MAYVLLHLLILVLVFENAAADCTPQGIAGQIQWFSSDNKVKYCDGTDWKDTSVSNGGSCSGVAAGTIDYSGGDLRFCNSTPVWVSMKGAATGAACAGVTSGTFNYDTSGAKYRVCVSGSWFSLGAAGSCSLPAFTPASPVNASDNTPLYFSAGSNNQVLTSPISSMINSYDNQALAVGYARNSQPVFFKPDGTAMYYIATESNLTLIYQFTLSTAWDVTTAVYANKTFSLRNQLFNPRDLFISSDGTKLMVYGVSPERIYQYSLATAWDISTAVYDNKSYDLGLSNSVRFTFKPDGTGFYTGAGGSVNRYSLSTAWDISTAASVSTYLTTAQTSSVYGVSFKSDGTRMILLGFDNDRVYQYSLSTAWDTTTATYDNKSYLVSGQAATPHTLVVKGDGTKFYIVNASVNAFIYQYSMSTAWDVSTASYESKSMNLVFEDDPKGMAFKSDGTAVYVVGLYAMAVIQIPLSTAWDLTSANFSSRVTFALPQEGFPTGIAFKSDGTKMFVTGRSGDAVHQYTLSTAWNVTTASFVSSYLVTGQTTDPDDLYFKSDGTKMYVVEPVLDRVYQYALSTAWDVSTATYESKMFSATAQDTDATGLFFSSDGSNMYVLGVEKRAVHKYSLSTAWDVSTASYTNVSFPVSNEETLPRALALSSDSSKMFIVGDQSMIFKYTLAPLFPVSFNSMSALSWRVEYAQFNRVNDTLGLGIRVMRGATVLAAADSSGTYATVSANITNGTDATSAVTAFAYVNTSALKSDWEAAVVELRQSYSQASSPDGAYVFADWVELSGTCQ